MDGGIKKIEEASVQLDALNKQLVVQKVVLAESTESCQKLLEEITTNTTDATAKQKLAEAKGADIETQSIQIAIEKKEAEDGLAVEYLFMVK